MFEQNRYAPSVQLRLMRLLVIVAFIFLFVRIYQLQIVEGDSFRGEADQNRFRLIESPPPRGVIYDRNGEILARNRPSFVVSVVPADLPTDDLDTPDVDEQFVAIRELLLALGVHESGEMGLRIQQAMFRRLGHLDYARSLARVGVPVQYTEYTTLAGGSAAGQDGSESQPVTVLIPDISEPLPLDGQTILVQRAVELARQGSAFEPVPVLNLVEREQALTTAEDGYRLPGLMVNQVPVREYVYGELTSHLLGFMGPIPAELASRYRQAGYNNLNEQVGLSGLEASYQERLRGIPGQKYIEVDILGREQRTVGEPLVAVPGQNLYLNVDLRLQRAMVQTLSEQAQRKQSPSGVAIAMEPKTGAILGLVSLPSFDNNIFAEGIGESYLALERDPAKPLINYAIGGLYPPGSVYKIVTASGSLMEGVITPATRIVDNGPLFLANRFFPNDPSQAQKFVSWNHRFGISHGSMNVVEAMALSNDIFFYWLGGGYPNRLVGLGDKRLAHWTRLFGFGDTTGIDLPGEVGAAVPDDQWKRVNWAESWVTGDSYNMAIGQGYVLATPLQVLLSFLPIANGGTLHRPQVVGQITDAEGGLQRDFTPELIRKLPLDATTLATVQEGLWAVVNGPRGTARNGSLPGLNVTVAGKTGTAEFCDWVPEEQDCRRDAKDNLPTHAWYVAYAPYADPQIALVVFLHGGGEGSEAAVPVATRILQIYFTEIRPDLAGS